MPFQKGHKINIGNQFAKGVKHTPDWKETASMRMKGNTQGFKTGETSPRKGKKTTKPAWNKGKKFPQFSGENHPNWTGGKTRDIHSLFNPQYVEWRNSVFTRDNWKCRIADENCGGQLEAHHILRWADFPELRYKTNNGITLCHRHHPRKKVEEVRLTPIFRQIIDFGVSHLNVKNEKAEQLLFQ